MPIESARLTIIAVLLLVGMFLADSRHVERSNVAAPYTDSGSRQ